MIRKACLTSVMLLALAGCDQIQQATAPTEKKAATPAQPRVPTPLLVTGSGWGPLRIGMTTTQVTEALGADANPEAVGGPEPGVCDQFRPARAPVGTLVMIENGRLSRISLTEGSTLKTERGFGVGSTAAEIKAAYGGAVVAQPHKYQAAPAEDLFVWASGGSTGYVQDPDARGVRYEIGGDGKVMTVHAGGPSIQLVEGCS